MCRRARSISVPVGAARYRDDGRLSAAGIRDGVATIWSWSTAISAAARTAQPAGRPAKRWRAARCWAIGRALMNRPTLLAARRAVARLSPIRSKRFSPSSSAVNEEQACIFLLSSRTQGCAGNRALRLCARDRPGRDERLLRAADEIQRTSRSSIWAAKEEGRGAERRWKKKKTWR